MNYNQEISVKAADLSHLECSQTFFLLYIRITIKKKKNKEIPVRIFVIE